MIAAILPPQDIDAGAFPSKDGNADGGIDGARSGEGADTALEILIRKRKEAAHPIDIDLGDCLPPEAPVPPQA